MYDTHQPRVLYNYIIGRVSMVMLWKSVSIEVYLRSQRVVYNYIIGRVSMVMLHTLYIAELKPICTEVCE